MADKNRPLSSNEAPDPARIYERAKPEAEAGMGRMDNNPGTPTSRPDQADKAVHKTVPSRHLSAHDVVNPTGGAVPQYEHDQQASSQSTLPTQPDHSMNDEEPLGWDQAPQNIKNPSDKRHPKKEGKGGTA